MYQQTHRFDYFAPTKIVYEAGSAGKVADIITRYGSRFLLVNIRQDDQNPDGLKALESAISSRSSGCVIHNELIGDPDTEQVDSAAYFAKRSHVDCIVAYGSLGSINTAKAISILVNNSFFAANLLNQNIEYINPPMPLIIVPTEPTAGEELSGYFTLIDAENNVKQTYSHEFAFPKVVIYDIMLSAHLNSEAAAKTAGALLSIAAERFFSPGTSPITDTLLLRVFEILRDSMVPFYKDPRDQKNLSNLFWASTMTGMSLLTSPNGINWALAQVISNKTQLTFHHALSLMLPYVMEFYLTVVPERYVAISKAFKQETKDLSVVEAAIAAIEFIRNLTSSLNLPSRLSEFYITQQQIPEIAKEAAGFPQLANSPKSLRAEEIESILLTAM